LDWKREEEEEEEEEDTHLLLSNPKNFSSLAHDGGGRTTRAVKLVDIIVPFVSSRTFSSRRTAASPLLLQRKHQNVSDDDACGAISGDIFLLNSKA